MKKYVDSISIARLHCWRSTNVPDSLTWNFEEIVEAILLPSLILGTPCHIFTIFDFTIMQVNFPRMHAKMDKDERLRKEFGEKGLQFSRSHDCN